MAAGRQDRIGVVAAGRERLVRVAEAGRERRGARVERHVEVQVHAAGGEHVVVAAAAVDGRHVRRRVQRALAHVRRHGDGGRLVAGDRHHLRHRRRELVACSGRHAERLDPGVAGVRAGAALRAARDALDVQIAAGATADQHVDAGDVGGGRVRHRERDRGRMADVGGRRRVRGRDGEIDGLRRRGGPIASAEDGDGRDGRAHQQRALRGAPEDRLHEALSLMALFDRRSAAGALGADSTGGDREPRRGEPCSFATLAA